MTPNVTMHAPTIGRIADYRAGLLAGLAAGLAMSVVMMALTTFMMQMGPWAGPKMAWSLLAGKDPIRPGFELVPVMGGMAIHFGLSAAYGLFFAWLQSLATVGEAALGALFGFALYVVNILIVPRVLPGMAGHMSPPNAMMHVIQAAEHVFFGLVLGAAYKAWRRA